MVYVKERHNKILEIAAKDGRVDATELMEVLNTSRETIRRDLNTLSKQGLLIKTHGGAISPGNNTFGFFAPMKMRENSHSIEKMSICSYAAKAINEYDTIFLDNSSTIMHIIPYIPKEYHITFITNSVKILMEFAILHNPNWNIISLGGALNFETFSTNRNLTINNLRNFKPNKAFISCHGIDEEFTVTDTSLDDVEIKKYILDTSKETYLLVDYSKLPRQGVVNISDASIFHCIITNDTADALFVSHLNSHGCTIQLAPTKNF